MKAIKVKKKQRADAFDKLLKSGEIVSRLPQNIFIIEDRSLSILDRAGIKYEKIDTKKIRGKT